VPGADRYRPSSYEGPLEAAGGNRGPLNYLAIGKRLVGAQGGATREAVMDGNIFNSKGVHVGVVTGQEAFNIKGQKLYNLKGINIYKLSGELVGHLADARGAEKHLGD
jgi:coproporphyrinogen III oxidase